MNRTDEKIQMVDSFVQLDHFPDEILLIILKNLENDEVLYSLMGVNQRLNRFVHASIFTSDLTLNHLRWNKFFLEIIQICMDSVYIIFK